MKYTGRITLLSLSLCVSLFEFILGTDSSLTEAFIDIFYTGIAWYVGRLYDQLKFLSFNDYLTKVYNRRYGDAVIPKLLKKGKIKKEPVAILSLDVNNFKSLNDTYGHHAGDHMLKKLSKILLENVRKSDLVFRWGGDEFLIFAQNSNGNIAKNLVTRINDAVNKEVKKLNVKNLNLGISIGYAEFPKDGSEFDELLSIADKKMYKLKISTK